jgi:D-amino-acid dehydrogenase
MHVVVIGAGVIGVTTAYYLSQHGCQVTVVDRGEDVANGASHANAGQLSYSFTDALAKPDFVSKLPAMLFGRDRGYRVRLSPDLIPWGLRFLSQCTTRRATENTVAVLKAALRSEQLMQELREKLPFDFYHRAAGKLVLLSSKEELRAAQTNVDLKRRHGCETEILSPGAAIDIEPALARVTDFFPGAVYSKSDSVADAQLFTSGLKEILDQSGLVTFRLGTQVSKLVKDGRKLRSIQFHDGEMSADAVVVCAGAWSDNLLRPLGINSHVYPVRGYSMTLPAGTAAPAASVTVSGRKIVFSRMNGRIRVAGFADFAGFRTDADAYRINTLLDIARDYAPLAADYDADERAEWGGFRPMTPNGQPLVGPSGIGGLYLNTGHGMLGWTLACASGYDIAQDVTATLN